MPDETKPPDAGPNKAYEVGYGKPPKHTRFKPGQSGNPKGRPKGTNNLKTDLCEELGEKVVVREGDRARHVSKQRALLKSLIARAIKGDARAGSLVMSMMMRLLDTGEGTPEIEEPLYEDEREILRAFESRVRRTPNDEPTEPAVPHDEPEEAS